MTSSSNGQPYAPTVWGETFFDVTVPSGQTCQVRQIQMDDLIELDILEQIDSLSSTVQTETVDPVRNPRDHQQRQRTKAEQAEDDTAFVRELMADKTQFARMSLVIDKVVAAVVVQPPVTLAYHPDGTRLAPSERTDGVIYTDSVGFNDKMFLFDECFGGIRKLEQFRDEADGDVGTVAGQPGDAHPPEPTPTPSGSGGGGVF